MRRISVLGATGSVGQSTLDLIRRAEPGAYRVVALTGGTNVGQLARDARALNAEIAVIADPDRLAELRDALDGTDTQVAAGADALRAAAREPADWVMSAIVGFAGLAPGLAAIEAGATLALANKESMVCAGPLMLATARAAGVEIVPVDSEHSGVAQCLRGADMAEVEGITITASGGAFRDWSLQDMARATPQQAATHPNWDMGQRITIDSASMFNKALEVIETKEFFGIDADRIRVLVHRQSILHAAVQFRDGALMAHLGPSDMRHAIGHALGWPGRSHVPVERIDLATLASLEFEIPDETRWPALRLARDVAATGGMAGTIFNAAKEEALTAFIGGGLGFLQMAGIVEAVLDKLSSRPEHIAAAFSLDNIAQADHLARITARETINKART